MSKFALLSYEFKESMLIALRAIRANKIRSSLTMLGIFIGVTVVVLMTTAIKGIDNSFQQESVPWALMFFMFKNGLGFQGMTGGR